MALPTIAEMITNRLAVTEATLTDAGSGVDYATEKARAIERAKRELYLAADIPAAEADIPEIARLWIADDATLLLIPLARDYYMQQQLSDAKQEATVTYYNKVVALNRLEDRLQATLARSEDAAREAISVEHAGLDAVPAVSVKGLPIDPLARAMRRGPFPP